MFQNLKSIELPGYIKNNLCLIMCILGLLKPAYSQTALPLTDLNSFKPAGNSWQIVGDVTADLDKDNKLNPVKGTGILLNQPDKKKAGVDLISNFEHGDIDLELDFMLAKNSNSGIYLQGQYEVQLEDSWGVKTPTSGNTGGIYERWDAKRPTGQQGYEGYAPRQNAGKAPGLWQHLKVKFQAPRFSADGQKIQNAKMLLVELNGVNIHENVVLLGPTRGALSEAEKATGPLRLQGDHGAIAFRNIQITNYDKPRAELIDLRYNIYKGKFDRAPDFSKLPPEAKGTSAILTSTVNQIPNEFLIQYQGKLRVPQAGEYTFNMTSPGGIGILKVNNNEIAKVVGETGQGKVMLPAGDISFELLYSKYVSYIKPILGLTIAGPGFREYLVSDATTIKDPVDPIFVPAPTHTLLRSFIDLPEGQRLTHAISVGNPEQLHYTFDFDRGALALAWRGPFMDATPMWQDRGDGSSRPLGMLQPFGKPVLLFGQLSSEQALWPADTTGSNYRPIGYTLDPQDLPTFQYQVHGALVTDVIRVIDNGQGLQRTLTVQNSPTNFYARLASGKKIEVFSKNMYLIDDKAYYLKLENAGSAKPIVRAVAGGQELLIPVQNTLSYSVIF